MNKIAKMRLKVVDTLSNLDLLLFEYSAEMKDLSHINRNSLFGHYSRPTHGYVIAYDCNDNVVDMKVYGPLVDMEVE